MRIKMLLQWAAFAALLTVTPLPVQAATFNVANGDVAGLRTAINNANANSVADTINLAINGSYVLNSVDNSVNGATGLPVIMNDTAGDDLIINGNGAKIERFEQAAADPAFRLMQTAEGSSLTLKNLILLKGKAVGADLEGMGGGILNYGTLVLTGCIFNLDNASNYGGAVGNYRGSVTATNCTFKNSEADRAGGIYNFQGILNITGGTFSGCVSPNLGGGIYNDGSAASASTTISKTLFEYNSAEGYGGAIYNDGNGSATGVGQATLTLTECTFDSNSAAYGGALMNDSYEGSATASATSCQFTENTAFSLGGMVFNYGGMATGRAQDVQADLILTNCAIFANSASDGGGAIENYGEGGGNVRLTATGCLFKLNSTDSYGGAVDNDGYGGIAIASLSNCTLTMNSAPNYGGAVANTAGSDGNGTTTLSSCTFADNTATNASSVFNALFDTPGTATVQIQNTLFKASVSGADLSNSAGTITSLGYNLSSDNGSGFLTAATDQINKDPKLGPLADNGGPTQTFALLSDSPAIDKGKSFGLNTDQRGQTRPFDQPAIAPATGGDNSDIGAFEVQPPPPTLSINNATLTEGNGGTSSATFTVALSRASTQPVTVQYATANNSATSGSDYTTTSGTLNFAAGETSKTIVVPVIGDTLDEDNETFFVNLSNASNATVAVAQGQGTITDDDAKASLRINDITVTEGTGTNPTATFTVTLNPASGKTVSVSYATANGGATQPDDYTSQSGTLTFTPGQTSKTISVIVIGDAIDEGSEVFKVNLSNAINANIADGIGKATITDDDALPTLSVADATPISEDGPGAHNSLYVVTLSGATNRSVKVDYASTAGGTATQNVDFTAVSGTLTFTPGQTSKTIVVPVLADTLEESDETIRLTIKNATFATISDGLAQGKILDNDHTLSINDVSKAEGSSGTTSFTFTVSLSAASGQAVTVSYVAANGTATKPSDYAGQSGTLTFAPGETTKTITISVVGDTVNEADETFFVNLSSASGATILDGQGQGIILNDDASG